MKRSVLTAVLATLFAGAAFAQDSGQQEILAAIPDSPDATTTCSSTYTSGFEDSFFQWCLTSNGNIAQYKSPNEHIRVGAVLEGYQICDVTPNVGYFDYAQQESGNWKTAILTQPNGANTFPVTVKRTTADGHFTLTQKFTQDTARRMIIITMMIKNNTTVAHDVFVYRFADLDINGALINTFDNGVDSAWGYDSGTFGVHLVLQTNEFGNGAHKYKLSTGVLGACANPSDPDGPVTEDGAIFIRALVPLAAKATATVIFNYRTM
jgi:hypothetical protein